MRIVRYRHQREVGFGVVDGERVLPVKDPFTWAAPRNAVYRPEPVGAPELTLADVELTTPCRPSKIVCIGVNYRAHAAEMGKTPPAEPMLFLKAPSSILPTGGTILRPPDSERVDFEGELGVVIGKPCRHVPAERAAEVIFGYTCVNDVTARDLQRKDVQFTRGKGFDTFCPFGPWIETEFDPADVGIRTQVNEELKQNGRTSDLIHDVPRLVAFISRVMTLMPGDLIATGTPEGVGPIVAGDIVTVSIDGIGTLENRVADDDPQPFF